MMDGLICDKKQLCRKKECDMLIIADTFFFVLKKDRIIERGRMKWWDHRE